MSETPLQKLLRLKREKEQANVNIQSGNTSNSETQFEATTLETVSGQGSSSPVSLGAEGSGVSSSEGGVALPEEKAAPDQPSGLATSDSSIGELSVSAPQVTQPVQETKQLSAMDRLRALKSGGSNFNGAGKGVIESTIAKQEEAKTPIETVLKDLPPPKPRKTHPIAMEMAELEAALDAQVPGFVSILSTIHKKLRADPDVVTLLDDEEIAIIVAGLEKHTNVTIVAPSAVKAAKSKARKEPVSAMDL